MEDHGAAYLSVCEAFRVQELDATPRARSGGNGTRETQEG